MIMKKKSHQSAFVNNYGTIIALSVLLFITTFLAWNKTVIDLERTITELFYSVPKRFDIITINITHFGSLAALYSAVAVLLIMGFKRLGFLLLGNGLVAYFVASVSKELIARPRPPILWESIIAREWGMISYGYPSGHSALIAAMVLTLWPYVKKPYRPWLVVLVVLVASSRIILGVHQPLDVVGGVLIGVLVGMVSRLIVSKNRLIIVR